MTYAPSAGFPCGAAACWKRTSAAAGNLALAALPNFTLPGDISASARYYALDLAEPNFVLNGDSTITVPNAPGLGVQVIPERLAAARLRHLAISAE